MVSLTCDRAHAWVVRSGASDAFRPKSFYLLRFKKAKKWSGRLRAWRHRSKTNGCWSESVVGSSSLAPVNCCLTPIEQLEDPGMQTRNLGLVLNKCLCPEWPWLYPVQLPLPECPWLCNYQCKPKLYPAHHHNAQHWNPCQHYLRITRASYPSKMRA